MGRVLRVLWDVLAVAAKGYAVFKKIVLNLLFILFVCVCLYWLFRSDRPEVPGRAVLVLAPRGTVVEQVSPGSLADLAGRMGGLGLAGDDQTLLKDLLDAVDSGSRDPRVKALLLDLDQLSGAGMTKLQDLRKAVVDFKKSGKKVFAWSDDYSQSRYYLAAQADVVYLNRAGGLVLEGFGRYRNYYKDGLDRLGVDVNVFRVGEFKSAVEPYVRDGMSDEDRESSLKWMNSLWDTWLADVTEARKLKAGEIASYIDDFGRHVAESGGDTALSAQKARLVDRLATRDEFRDDLVKVVGEDPDTHSFYQIRHDEYLESLGDDRFGKDAKGDSVAVVVACGEISDGSRPPGSIGGDSTAALVRKAREDRRVKAIVLRVDSGGGSAFASEIVRRELEIARKAGKPVVASMGSVAASGGYWITLAADEIWAYPTTITGSIGIFGMFPTFQKPLEKLAGVRTDGVGTTKLAGAMRMDRALPPEGARIIQSVIDKGYADFIQKVSQARHMEPGDVDRIARGRVWSGRDALQLRLVDRLGGLREAVESAAAKAKLKPGFGVTYVEKDASFRDRLFKRLAGQAAALLPGDIEGLYPHAFDPLPGVLRVMWDEASELRRIRDPHGVYAYFGRGVE